jgi:hypothetical protein
MQDFSRGYVRRITAVQQQRPVHLNQRTSALLNPSRLRSLQRRRFSVLLRESLIDTAWMSTDAAQRDAAPDDATWLAEANARAT